MRTTSRSPFVPHGLALSISLFASIPATLLQGQEAGELWYRRSAPGLVNDLNSVAYGNGTFVAVGKATSVARSTDGIQWLAGSAGSFGDLSRIRFVNGQFVALGNSNKLLFSDDGSSWTPRTVPATSTLDIAFGNGVYVLATDLDPLRSTDGVTWTPLVERDPNGLPWQVLAPAELKAVTWGNGRFAGLRLVQSRGIPYMAAVSSLNGVDWTQTSSPVWGVDDGRISLEYGLNRFAMTLSQKLSISFSPDGSDWNCQGCQVPPLPPSYEAGIAVGSGVLLDVRGRPTFMGFGPEILASTDGATWTPYLQFPPPLPDTDPLFAYYQSLVGYPRGVASGAGSYVVVGDGGYIIHSGPAAGSPSIRTQPEDAVVTVGLSTRFTVLASGAPPLAYQWFHNGIPISGATDNVLNLPQVQINDAGDYHVTVTNSTGTASSRTTRLSVSFIQVEAYAGIRINGVVGQTYRIEATPAVGPLNWQSVGTLTLNTTPQTWIDLETPNLPQRLYRVTQQP